ncbi:MAG: site-specific integrase [Proteiniphilum sp.]
MESHERTRFQEWVALWLEKKKTAVKPTSLSIYTVNIRKHIMPCFGNSYIEDIDVNSIIVFIEELEESAGLKPKTIEDIFLLLQQIVKDAIKEKKLLFEEARMHLPAKDTEEADTLASEEFEKLLNFLMINPSGRNAGIMIAQLCGLRIGEICGLKWEDIDINERVIHVRRTISRLYISSLDSDDGSTVVDSGQPKTKRSQRNVPVPKRLCFYLEQVKIKASPDEKSFITTGKDKSHEPRTFSSYYCNVLKQIGLKHHTFHSLRHTFATRAIQKGMDAETLSRILGHASVTITLSRYYHPTTKDLVNAIDRIYP